MTDKARDPRRSQSGQNLVEFALTLPVFVALIVGFFYSGILLYDQVTLANAARVGTSYLVRNPMATDAEVESVIKGQIGVLDPADLTISIAPPREDRVPYVQLSVSLRYRAPSPRISVPNLTGGRPILLVGPLVLRADSTMNVE
ncbi:MAG: TadE family protein [Anaerolineae bacterium]